VNTTALSSTVSMTTVTRIAKPPLDQHIPTVGRVAQGSTSVVAVHVQVVVHRRLRPPHGQPEVAVDFVVERRVTAKFLFVQDGQDAGSQDGRSGLERLLTASP